jgi:hypothetical protein
MSDVLASKLSLMGLDRFMPLEKLPLVFFKMTVADNTGLIIAIDHDMTADNMALLKKMAAAFSAKLQSHPNTEFDYNYMWLFGSDLANHVSGNSLDLNEWLNGKHVTADMQVFVYPSLTEIAVNSSYKSFVWRSFSEYIK